MINLPSWLKITKTVENNKLTLRLAIMDLKLKPLQQVVRCW